MTTHAPTRSEQAGMLTISCCTWSVTATSPGDRRWAEQALTGHLGIPIPHRRRCHALCFDEHGHTDGCIMDDLDRGDD